MLKQEIISAGKLSAKETALPAPKELQFRIFCGLWGVATLFHMAQSSAFDAKLHYVLLTFAAIHVLYRPSILSLLILLSLQLGDVFYKMPALSNHWLFTAFVNITILQGLAFLMIRQKTFSIRQADLVDTFAPIVRVEVIILYFFVVFHKLNYDFFLPVGSCAALFLEAQNSRGFFHLPPEVLALNAYATVFIEALIPVLLCFRFTRKWGLLIGLVFHCIIAYNPLNGFYDFSSMIFAVYFLFTSPEFALRIAITWAKVKQFVTILRRRNESYSHAKLLLSAAYFLGVLVSVNLLTKRIDDFHLFFFWTGFSFIYIYLFFRHMRERRPNANLNTVPATLAVPHRSFVILPALVFLNGLSPYLGLKTENSFAMFSNIKTENGNSNHLLVPASVQLFNFQKDMVEVVRSSDEELQDLADKHKLMTYFEFKDYVALQKPEEVTYIYKGQQHTFSLAEAKQGNALLTPNPYILRRLLSFREINKFDPQPCYH
jgi:hypothetical protein